ncbi:MAG TPA: amino acid racemase [Vicinamibacterales bacterium]|nr:amino acid racemase [Vicinamibacterales bacterium]
MKTIGIVGGIGPESTIAYYRWFIAAGHSALLINSVEVKQLLDAMMRQDLPFVTDYLVDAVAVLAKAGASVGLIAANTPHIVFDDVQRRSSIPLVSIIEATCAHVKSLGLRRVALMGTRYTMEGRFYPAAFEPAGIELVVPPPDDLSFVHDIYVMELLKNQFLPETRRRLLQVIDRLIDDQNVEAVILGGTELPLVLTDASHRRVPLLDTTRIHVDAAIAAVDRRG